MWIVTRTTRFHLIPNLKLVLIKEQKIGYIGRYIAEISYIGRYRYDFTNYKSVGQKIGQKLIKSLIFQGNIINFRYFDEILRVYPTHACAEISRKISINIRDILIKYWRYIGKILEIYRLF